MGKTKKQNRAGFVKVRWESRAPPTLPPLPEVSL